MNAVIAWFAENRVAANVLMVIILVAGFGVLPSMPKEMIPAFEADTISILAPYPGASPQEAEEAVCRRIERAIQNVKGIDKITASARENSCGVSVSVIRGSDSRAIEEKIKSRVDAISGLPALVPKISVERSELQNLVAKVVVYGNARELALMKLAEQVRDDLTDMDNITHVILESVKPYEISIELSEPLLQRYGLTFIEVVQAVRTTSMKTSSGDVKTGEGSISVTASGQATNAQEYMDIVLRATPDGGRIKLSDVATVTDGFAYSNASMRFNGEPAIVVDVFQVGAQNILDISKTLYKYVDNPTTPVPAGIKLEVIQDLSSHFQSRIDLLVRNAASGLALVFISLMLFLRLRLSFWVSLGIPIAFLGAMMWLPLLGTSINMVSTFAFLLVLGIVVDDAIIIGENIFSQTDKGIYGTEAAVKGAQEVAKPVVFAIVTTILFFLPLLFLPGVEGHLIRDVPIVVIAVLIFSLVECLLILPAHLTNVKKIKETNTSMGYRIQQRFAGWMQAAIEDYYKPLLEKSLARPYLTLIIFSGIFFLTLSILIGGWVKVKIMSEIEADVTVVKLAYPKGTHIDVTRDGIARIEAATIELRKELMDETGVDQIKSVGISAGTGGDHKALIVLELASSEAGRDMSGLEISKRLRKKVGPIPEANVAYKATVNPKRKDIDIVFHGRNDKNIIKATHDFRDVLKRYPGVYGVSDSLMGGSKEVVLNLKPAARDLGLTLNDLAGQVQQAFHGVHVQSLQRSQSEVKVFVRYPEKDRNSLWHLENMNVRLFDGSTVILSAVADVSYARGPAHIRRVDGKRVNNVNSFIDDEVTTRPLVMADLKKTFFKDFKQKYPGVQWGIAGAQKNTNAMLVSLLTWYCVALLAMFALMAILFRSYSQPFVIMSAIPFGLIGAVAGHWLMGFEFTIWSLTGMVAVSGVVVNDNLVLIDYINERRKEGVNVLDAIRDAGVARFRPIWLTTITTFIGLVPLMLETSVQAQFLVPMAISLAFGELFATAISLIMVPATYYVLDSLQTGTARSVKQWKTEREDIDEESMDMDEVYQQGFLAGMSGKARAKVPFQAEVLIASWEAGWDDGEAKRNE